MYSKQDKDFKLHIPADGNPSEVAVVTPSIP